jgi:hypothetical protein
MERGSRDTTTPGSEGSGSPELGGLRVYICMNERDRQTVRQKGECGESMYVNVCKNEYERESRERERERERM